MKRACSHLCPFFQTALEVVAKPWNGLIIATLESGSLRFSELSERLSAIGDRMLSLRLKELESQGVVHRQVHVGPPVRVEYSLTEAGRGFRSAAAAMAAWGEQLTRSQTTSGRDPIEDESC
jgi:DNA-binding HxlR family transcriptional regulator